MTLELWMLLHMVGVIVFFSNAVAALLWRGRAEEARSAHLLAYAYRTLSVGDAWLTPISVVVIVASGIGAARRVGLPLLGTEWIVWSVTAFSLSGLLFVFRVAPLQRAMAERAERGVANGEFDLEAHRRDASRWTWWAHTSLLCAAASIPLMVLKPE